MSFRPLLSARFLLALFLLCDLASALPVEVSHPVADFLRRLEEKGILHPGFWSTLPVEQSAVVAALEEARQKEASLSSWDRRRLERYLNEFDPVRKRAGTRLRYEDSAFTVFGRAEYFTGGYVRDSVPEAQRFLFGSFSPGIEGAYGKNVYFLASATVGMERSHNPRLTMNYDPQRGLPYNTSRDDGAGNLSKAVGTFDGFRTVMGVGSDRLSIEAGQDWNQWGPGHWQHTTFGNHPHFWVEDSLAPSPAGSPVDFNGTQNNYFQARRGYRYPGEGPPLPQIRLRMGGARWEYVKVVAQRMGMDKDSAAHLVAHRLQINLGDWKFGAMEMLTIGTRAMDGIILLPGVPLKFAEHSGGDRDNSAMAADAEWTWRGHGRFYGEFFVDDFSGPPLKFWGNKFAWVLGGALQDPLGLPSEIHLEYAHVDPWVYGHHLYNTSMQNYGALLGSSLPPNSRAVFASASFPLPLGLEGLAEYRFGQRDFQSRGSSIFDDYFTLLPADNDKHFLAQDVETRHDLMVSAEWSWERYVRLRGGLGGLWVDNRQGRPGEDLVAPALFTEIYLRY